MAKGGANQPAVSKLNSIINDPNEVTAKTLTQTDDRKETRELSKRQTTIY